MPGSSGCNDACAAGQIVCYIPATGARKEKIINGRCYLNPQKEQVQWQWTHDKVSNCEGCEVVVTSRSAPA